MKKLNFDELVKVVLKEVMNQIGDKATYKNSKKAIVFFTGTPIGVEESIIQVKKLKYRGISFRAVLSEASLNILDMNMINDIFGKENIYVDGNHSNNKKLYEEDFELLIGANLSTNSLAKIANGIGDTLPTALISKCILNGTQIIISKDAIDLKMLNINGKVPIPYINMIKRYLEMLESYGIELLNSKDLFDFVINNECVRNILESDDVDNKISINNSIYKSQCTDAQETSFKCKISKKVISREDIVSNSESKNIVIPSNAIITALAKDLIDELGIQIIKR
ncbi:flavoprotein [Clostridium weizhouense]|uniref:flavoprotein n=1 Tax=Clostridium weizhouense TaxID=2859781 RepID=UPI0027E5ACAC|nr:flavoprotein [Clostridium weizhouense]